jgi:acyl-CoA thioester hydrolase
MRDGFSHWIQETVRWGDMDALGHVNNAVYFVYCESARMAFFESTDLRSHTQGGRFGPALATATCNFRQQVHHPATLDVGLQVGRVGTKSFTLEYGLFRRGEDQPVADGSSVVVWVDYESGSSAPLPEALKQALSG